MSNSVTKSSAPLILTVDTSSPRSGLAIARGAELIAHLGFVGEEKRSSQLLGEIDWLLSRVGLAVNDLDAFATIIGPGSFTGLRVGLATIKGFAHALKKPVINITSLEANAYACPVTAYVCTLIDAHRNEVYAQFFQRQLDCVTPLSEPVVTGLKELLEGAKQFQQESLVKRLFWSGDGLLLHQEAVVAYAQEQQIKYSFKCSSGQILTEADNEWILDPPQDFLIGPAARYAYEKFQRGEVTGAADFTAYYIRPTEAEVKLKLGLLGKKKDALREETTK